MVYHSKGGYILVELLHLYLVQLVVDCLQPHLSAVDYILEVLLGLEQGHQLLLVAGLFELWHFFCDLVVELGDVPVLQADEVLDLVAGHLQLVLHHVDAFDLGGCRDLLFLLLAKAKTTHDDGYG